MLRARMVLLVLLTFCLVPNLVVTEAQAQSEVRIRRGGKEANARIDTVWRVRVDTVRLEGRTRVDTLRLSVLRVDTVFVKERSCWSWTGKCTLITAGSLVAGFLGYKCITDWCKDEQRTIVDVEVNRSSMRLMPYFDRPRRAYGLVLGFGF